MLAFRALTPKSCPSLVRIHTSARWSGARVAVVLSGCGVYDGTEIHEASASLGVEKDLNLSAIASIGDQSLGKRIKMV
ncbi:glutamine amidotransferase-like class 1 domain-containing protein 3B, mitochondrial [Electrophorus electricus]|uniref:glutamine amidotransferase-like class 1 domain-containing protein 3B, mitochondrial n=1 Tax=Electrophorus electricus TaxID=8005 RepID=UPI0015CFB935|nr:glutamine amidotransferase-like class 1 domain-containing protein 3B, mitochondrial [Electrophorus electricus]